jgi:sortase A
MRKLLRSTGNVLLTTGIALMVCAVTVYARTSLYQAELKRQWEAQAVSAPRPKELERPTVHASSQAAGLATSAATDTTVSFREGEAVARLRIPRIDLDLVVLEGISDETLDLAAGRYPGMSFPGEGGHTVISAHRDTFFRNVGKLQPGDRVSVTRWDRREVVYVVSRTYIVHKSNRTVIVPRSDETLSLITCYPFVYSGRAPYRYIVEARASTS